MNTQLLAVLRQLTHADFRSGEEVAQCLRISRASVHNAVRAAASLGLPIQAVRGRGYRLARPVTWLDAQFLAASLSPLGFQTQVRHALDSTNDHLLGLARSGAPHKSLVTAEWQSQGRGRRGRTWLAGLGGGLMFSLLWRFNRGSSAMSGLSLVVGLGLAQVLHEWGLRQARVKWPNDILINEAKLAGVLIELVGDMLGPCAAVIGVGMNVLGGESISERVAQPVTDLHAHLAPDRLDRNGLLRALVERLNGLLEDFDRAGFAPFRAQWEALHAHQNQTVQIHHGHAQCIDGRALGVDETGALLLDTGHGLQRIHSGEVSLRSVS